MSLARRPLRSVLYRLVVTAVTVLVFGAVGLGGALGWWFGPMPPDAPAGGAPVSRGTDPRDAFAQRPWDGGLSSPLGVRPTLSGSGRIGGAGGWSGGGRTGR